MQTGLETMDMHELHRRKIDEIKAGMDCPKAFQCLGDDGPCQAKDLGLENCVECLYEQPRGCTFSLSFGHGYLCRCPMRIYLAQNLKK